MKIAQWLGVPKAEQIAAIVAPHIIANLDKYHGEWAGFNREIEGRVVELERARGELTGLVQRITALEDDRTKLRVDVQGTLEMAERLFARIRMRNVRAEASQEPDQGEDLLLMRKGIR